jgi:hypothetical protein
VLGDQFLEAGQLFPLLGGEEREQNYAVMEETQNVLGCAQVAQTLVYFLVKVVLEAFQLVAHQLKLLPQIMEFLWIGKVPVGEKEGFEGWQEQGRQHFPDRKVSTFP